MLIKQIIHSKYLYIEEPVAIQIIMENNINKIHYRSIKDLDNSECIIAENLKEENRKDFHTICKSIHGFKTRIPSILLSSIGKEVTMYYDYVNALPNELFRIKSLIKHCNPYFTSRTFVIPYSYVNTYLNETASISRVSFNLTTEPMLNKGQLRAQLVLHKSREWWNYPLYKSTNGLTTKTIVQFMNFLYGNNQDIENFIYERTVESRNNESGVMVFKEEL